MTRWPLPSLLLVLFGGAACSGGARSFSGVDAISGLAVSLHPHAMPAARTFSGTYRSAQLGTLHLTQERSRLSGSFARALEGCALTGTVKGTVHENVAELAWEQVEVCSSGRRHAEGRGFFLYDLRAADRPAQLFGRRYLTAYPYVQSDDEPYNWLNFAPSDPWTAIEAVTMMTPGRGGGWLLAVLYCLVFAACAARPGGGPQPMHLRLDVIERALTALETCSIAGSSEAGAPTFSCPRCDGGALSAEPSIELHQALRRASSALDALRDALEARENGDGRLVDERVDELSRRLGQLERVLSSAGIAAPPGLSHVLGPPEAGLSEN